MGDLEATIAAALRDAGTPERAEHQRAYLKSDLRHYGVSVPALRALVKARKRELDGLAAAELRALVDALWKQPVYELRAAAVEILDLYRRRLVLADVGRIERFVREARTWALVDVLAVNVAGTLCVTSPCEMGPVLDRWIADEDFWVRRAAMLALLTPIRRGDGDTERFLRYADSQLEDREFFIRKAIGWVLREMGKKRPGLVAEWLSQRTDRASGVTVREAVKYLDPPTRDALLLAYRERRGGHRAPTGLAPQ